MKKATTRIMKGSRREAALNVKTQMYKQVQRVCREIIYTVIPIECKGKGDRHSGGGVDDTKRR